MLMEFPHGVSSTAQVGMWSADQDTIEITGSRGRLSVPHAFLCGPDDGDFTITVDGVTETIEVPRVNHYTSQAEHFSARYVASTRCDSMRPTLLLGRACSMRSRGRGVPAPAWNWAS